MTDRPSLSEMAAQSNGDAGRGIRCPSCGAGHLPNQRPFEVIVTNPLGPQHSAQRRRKCRNCGREFLTAERVVGMPVR